MASRSTAGRFGVVAIANHWITALLIVIMLIMGFSLGAATDSATKVAILRIHAPLGILVLLLTLFRVVWWLFIDKKPEPIAGLSRPMTVAASSVHGFLYLLMLVMAFSGIALMLLSGAGEIVIGGANRPLPDFDQFAPHLAHGVGAFILIALLVLHLGAAIYHQFIRRDRLLGRMGIGAP